MKCPMCGIEMELQGQEGRCQTYYCPKCKNEWKKYEPRQKDEE